MQFYLIWLGCLSVVAFVLYAVDKNRARRRKWRIPEATLILIAALGGAPGAFLAMQMFRHKTKHVKFIILVPLFLTLHAVEAVYLLYKFGL